MSNLNNTKYKNPFNDEERLTLKKWSGLSKLNDLFSPFQRKVLYETAKFDEIYFSRFKKIEAVLCEFSELLEVPEDDEFAIEKEPVNPSQLVNITENDTELAYELRCKILLIRYQMEADNGNELYYIPLAEAYYWGLFEIEKNHVKALALFKKAADASQIVGVFFVAEILFNQGGTDGNDLIDMFNKVVKYQYIDGDGISDYSDEAKEYLKELHTVEKQGNVLFPSVFKGTNVSKSDVQGMENADLFNLVDKKEETNRIEFKETAFYDVNGNAPGSPEAALIKTVAAFFNSPQSFPGGWVLIGIRDDGQILGLERYFKSIKKVNSQTSEQKKEDVFQSFIRDLLEANLNEDVIPNIEIKFQTRDDKKIVGLWVPKSPKRPVYIKPTEKTRRYLPQEFYVRHGNSSRHLKAESRDNYIKDNFAE